MSARRLVLLGRPGAAPAPATTLLRLAIALGAAGYAVGLSWLLVQKPVLAAAALALPLLLPWFGRAERVFWTLIGVWLLGAESFAVIPFFSIFKVLALLTLAVLGYEVATRKRALTIDRRFLLLLLAWFVLNTFASFRGRTPSVFVLVVLTSYIGLVVAALFPTWFITRREHVYRLVTLFRWQGLAVAVLAVLQVWFGDAFYLVPVGEYERRAYGTSANPNGLGLMMALTFPLHLHGALSEREPRRRLLWMVASILSFLAVIYSLSRSALAGVLVAAPLILATRMTLRRAAVIGLIGLVVSSLWSAHLADFVADRYELEGVKRDPRQQALVEAARLFARSPIAGIGIGQFAEQSSIGIPVHNAVVSVFVEAGLIGGLVFAWALMAATLHLLRLHRRLPRGGPDRALVWTLFATWSSLFLALNFHGGTERSNLLWFFIGLAHALTRIEWEPTPDEAASTGGAR